MQKRFPIPYAGNDFTHDEARAMKAGRKATHKHFPGTAAAIAMGMKMSEKAIQNAKERAEFKHWHRNHAIIQSKAGDLKPDYSTNTEGYSRKQFSLDDI